MSLNLSFLHFVSFTHTHEKKNATKSLSFDFSQSFKDNIERSFILACHIMLLSLADIELFSFSKI